MTVGLRQSGPVVAQIRAVVFDAEREVAATLDLRLQKVVTWAGRDFTLGIESYNLTNLRNEVEEWTLTGPLWRKPTVTQPPRVIRLTAGVTF